MFDMQNITCKFWKNPNIKSGECKKKPQDSGESWVNLMAEDEGFEFAEESPLVAKRPHLVSLSSDRFSKCTVCTIWNVV